MHVRDRLDEAKPKPGAFGRPAFLQAIEALEDLVSLFLWNSRAVVADDEDEGVRFGGNTDDDPRALRRVAHRVDEKIDAHLLEQVDIAPHP